MALHVALRHPGPLAGAVALSCHLVCAGSLEKEASEAARGLPIFLAHGTEDPLVPLEAGLEARDRCRALGCEVEWRTYPMGHAVVPEEIQEIGAWLGRRLSAAPARTGS